MNRPLSSLGGERLKSMNGVGRDGSLSGDRDLFDARGDCLPNAELALLLIEQTELTAIYRCHEIIKGTEVVGERVVQSFREAYGSYSVGFLPAVNDPGMGKIAGMTFC